MTISTTSIVNTYTGNGSTDAFAYTFKIAANADIKVYIRTIATGAEALKTLDTHYTVSGAGADSGGTVTFTSGNIPTDAQQIVLRRATTKTQTFDLVENDPFSADSFETSLDKITSITQELQEELDRSFKVSKTTTITTPEFVDSPTTRASKLLGFSSDGNSIEATTGKVATVTVSAVAAGGDPTVSYNDTTGALALGVVTGNTGATGAAGDVDDALTTRGDIIVRNASTSTRLAIGSANTVLTTDGTDPAWSTVTNAMLAGSITNAKLAGSIADSKLSTISTADKVAGGAIQIDSGTDGTSITIVDADKFLVDDGGTTKYVNASQLKTYAGGGKLTGEFISSATDITYDSVHSFSHSLSAVPSVVQVFVKCTDSGGDGGYSQGEYIKLEANGAGGSADYGYSVKCTNSAISVVAGGAIRAHNPSTLNEISLTASKWDFVVVAYAPTGTMS